MVLMGGETVRIHTFDGIKILPKDDDYYNKLHFGIPWLQWRGFGGLGSIRQKVRVKIQRASRNIAIEIQRKPVSRFSLLHRYSVQINVYGSIHNTLFWPNMTTPF